MREAVTVPVSDILSLVECAEDYGHANEVLMDGLAEMLGYELSDDEIGGYAAGYLTSEMQAKGYGVESAESAVERLEEWRRRYMRRNGSMT